MIPRSMSSKSIVNRSTLVRTTAILGCVLMLGGCAATKNLFSGKNSQKEAKPAKLEQFTPSVTASKLWSASVGKGDVRAGARQHPAIADGHVYAAGGAGVMAFDLASGKALWTYRGEGKKAASQFTGGPGVGGGLVVVGTLNGDVIALDQATGAVRWSGKVQNEVISAPAIGDSLVVVHSNDGRVTAFDAATGDKRWSWGADAVPLSVRGNSSPVINAGHVFVGTSSGRLAALSLADGSQLWEATIAEADGRSEIQRMNDSDGTPVVDGGLLYASSYKPRTVAIDISSGQLMWVQDHGGVGGVGLGNDKIAVTDNKDIVWAMDRMSGAPMWQQNRLTLRNVSAPVVQGGYAVVGDYEGYLHWLNLADGQFAARSRMGSKPILAQPVVSSDGVLVAQDSDGNIAAFRAGP